MKSWLRTILYFLAVILVTASVTAGITVSVLNKEREDVVVLSAEEYAGKCLAAGCDEVVGVGGGRIMDFSKAMAETAGLGTVNIPTSIATCAAFTAMSVMYTPEGAKKRLFSRSG